MGFSRFGALTILCVLAPFFVSAQPTAEFIIDVRYGENTEPPTVPTDVSATPISPSQIDIAWTASIDPFGVAGYQVFRNSFQVATTSLTSFSDIGLSPSTTYSYTIRAFDIDELISSSSAPVATTTFELPPPEEETESGQSSGSFLMPRLQNFTLSVGSEVARFDFGVNVPVSYRIEYRTNDTQLSGTVQTKILRQQHTTVLTDLVSNTTYFYELYVTDRFGRETRLRSGQFTTDQQFVVASPTNVADFRAQAFGSDVLLRWVPAAEAPYAYVRVVRNARFFPSDPLDGVIVYQGPATSFTDSGAMQGFDRQYYTIFAYNLAGVPSSGMVAVAARTPTVPSEPPLVTTDDAEDNEEESVTPPVVPLSRMTLADIEFIQHDRRQTLDNFVIITSDDSFVVRVAAAYIPSSTKTVMVTLWQLEDERALSFLLRLDEDSGYYKAVIPAQSRVGVYDIRLELYNGLQERFFYLTGLFAIEDPTESSTPDVTEDLVYVSLLYMVLGGLAGMVFALLLHRFFFLLWRRKDREEQKKVVPQTK